MRSKKSLKKNLIYNMLYQVIAMVLPLMTAPYISRILGPDGLGIYSYNYSIALYFVYFAMLGLLEYGNRTIASVSNDKEKVNKKFSSIYTFQMITSTVVLIIYLLYVLLFFHNSKNFIIPFIMTLHVLSAFFDISWLYFGLQEFQITATKQFIIKILTFVAIFIFVKNKEDLGIYTFIMSLSYFFSTFSLWLIIFKNIKYKRSSVKETFSHFKECIILFIPIIATSIYRLMDKIMLGAMTNITNVGYYENAEKIINVTISIIGAILTVMLPKMSNLVANKETKKAQQLMDKTMNYTMCLGIAITFGIISVANEFIVLFFGQEFKPSIILTIGLSMAIPFMTWSMIIRHLYLIPYKKDKIYIKSTIIGAILNLVCNLFFIPKFNCFGAVIGTCIAEIGVMLYQTTILSKQVKIKKYIKRCSMFILIGTIMYIIIINIGKVINTNLLRLLVKILLGSIIYIGLCILFFMIKYKRNKG